MYLVSRETEGDGKLMMSESEVYFETEEFARGIIGAIKAAKLGGRLAISNVNNSSLLRELAKSASVTSTTAVNIRRLVKEQAGCQEALTDAASLTGADSGKFDAIVECALLDRASKTVDSLKDIMNDDGVYVYYFALYEEMGLKRKVVSLLLSRYSVDVEVFHFKGLQLPVVLLVCRKGQLQPGSKIVSLKVGNFAETIEYLPMLSKVKDIYIKSLPQTAGVHDIVPGRTIIYDASNPDVDPIIPAYTIKLVDHRDAAVASQRTYACFIVPCGKERSFLYASEEGNFELSSQIKVSRLCIVILNVGHGFKTFEQMKADIESVVVEKKPKPCIGNIIYLTDSSPVQVAPERKTLFREEGVIVEDVRDGSGEVTRRLYNIKNFYRPQAQVVLDYEDGQLDAQDPAWGLLPFQPGKKPRRNPKMLDYAYNRSLFLASVVFAQQKPKLFTIIGSGSGILADYIEQHIKDTTVLQCDRHKTVVQAADQFLLSRRQTVEADGLEFIRQVQPGSQHAVIVDVDDGQEVPTRPFTSASFVSDAHRALTDRGVLVVNSIRVSGDGSKHLQDELMAAFDAVWTIKALREEYTVIVACKAVPTRKHAEAMVQQGLQLLKSLMTAEEFEDNEYGDILAGATLAHFRQKSD